MVHCSPYKEVSFSMQLTSSITFIRGTPGAGKTSLLNEIAGSAQKRGVRTITGRAYPAEKNIPYATLASAFVPLLQDIPESRINIITRGSAAEIGYLFPQLGFAQPVYGDDIAAFRHKALWTLVRLAQQLTDTNQVVITIDDLHWSDNESLESLHFLARHITNHPIKIAASYTPQGAECNSVLLEMEKSLTAIGIACTIDIAGKAAGSSPDAGEQQYRISDISHYLPANESLCTPQMIARARLKTGDYEGAISIWNDHGDEELESILNIGLALYWSGKYNEALAVLERGTRSKGDIETIARISLARAMCLQEVGRVVEARGDVDRALGIAESTNDESLRARAYRAMTLLYVWTGPARTAKEYGNKGIAEAKKAQEPTLEWSANWAMAVLAGMTGDARNVARHLKGCKDLEEALGSPVLPLWTAEIEIEYATGIGEWDKAISIGESAIAEARALNQGALLPRLLVWTGLAHLNVGNVTTAQSYFDEAWTCANVDQVPLGAHATILAHTGKAAYHLCKREFKEAIDIATRGVALADKMGYVVWAVHRLLPILGEAHLYLGDTDNINFGIAQSLCNRMRRDAQVLEHKLGMAWADACDGLLIMLRDKDPAGSLPLLRKSLVALENIPFVEYANKIKVQVDLAMERASLGVHNFTERERDIARLVSKGLSNKEIAREMDISDRTVTTHLSNIFAKAGVKSRGQLAGLLDG